ncbi:MAG: amino acid permease [Candidatus Kapabacteria bacterium]|nr:amino acid permease [Candidatus Kapabacteria bacterium]
MARNIWATKSIEQLKQDAEAGHGDGHGGGVTLKRTLGPWNLVALGIGAIIGAGLFSLTGIAAANNAGPAVTLSFVLAAVGCAFAGLCYAEFASMIPIAGSAYAYSYATMGELMAWIIGWDLVLEYAVGAATVGISWSGYFVSLLHGWGINLPPEFIASPWQPVKLPSGELVHGIINLPAALIVLIVSYILSRGTEESAFLNSIMVILKVAVVLVFIAIGYSFINPVNYTPYIPESTGVFGEFGYSGILRGAAVVFFAFIGFDAVSTAAQEAKNPQRDMPIGIIGSLVICTILYVLFSHVMTGMVNYTEFKGVAAPVALAIDKTGIAWLLPTIKIAILAGYTSVILVMLLGQSRVFFSMSKDGLISKFFSDTHPKYHTPAKSNMFFGVIVAGFAAFAPISLVGEVTSMGTLLAFILVCAGIIIMRKKAPDMPRAFKTPLVPLVPILGILFCSAMMLSLLTDWSHVARLFGWLAVGMIIYFTYSVKHSRLQKSVQ